MKRPKKEDKKVKKSAVDFETQQFEEYYVWLQEHMPDAFFEQIEPDQFTLITHHLMSFPLQDYFSQIQMKDRSFILTLDSPDVDLRVLKHFNLYGIRGYRTFISNKAAPFKGIKKRLRIAAIFFTSYATEEPLGNCDLLFSKQEQQKLYASITEKDPDIKIEDFRNLICEMDRHFLRTLTHDRLVSAILMFFRARERDHCQYEVRYNEDWKKKKEETPSVQIVFAWRNTAKYRFIYRLAKTIFRHNLKMVRVNAVYVQPYKKNNTLIMSLGLHGIEGKAAWEESDIADFLKELVTLKCFPGIDEIERVFVSPRLVTGNEGNLIRVMMNFIHQTLVHADINQYSLLNIEEGLCRHPEFTVQIIKAFNLKFHPENHDINIYKKHQKTLLTIVDQLDTGNENNDIRRKNILKTAMNFVNYLLKTNFFRNNKGSFSFRFDPKYLTLAPYDYRQKFPELPYSIFFIQGMYFIGFHIRFKDLSRGGLRTVFPQKFEQMITERNNVFSECYNLAYTQQKKNKDIPEGGSKGVLFLEPYERLLSEGDILRKELVRAEFQPDQIEEILKKLKKEQKLQYLYQTQRSFIYSLLTLINCHEDGTLKAKNIIDYWGKPEYLYLGPDENMHNEMIEWIANYSQNIGYKPGIAFISSKPTYGINHKEYGVTSLGVNVYMETTLKHLDINPKTDSFTVKMSGGPDGDVAGNQILNLYRFFPKTAKLVALTDISGTIYDPEGLDLTSLINLFYESKPLAAYSPKKLHNGGFFLDLQTKKEETTYSTKTLCWKREGGKLKETWLSGSDMNHIYHHSLHQIKADIFIPAGGRPKTLHNKNYTNFLDSQGVPSSQVIIEGANLYLTSEARHELEKLGVLIIKDSSANKGGVICSSMEILASLILTGDEFLQEKEVLMEQILNIIKEKAQNEANLLLKTNHATGQFLTYISDQISEKINGYTYELLNYLDQIVLASDSDDPLIKALLNICPPLLANNYREQVIQKLPLGHKKAMIACYLASQIVYKKGLNWSPSIVDVLPLIATDPHISSPMSLHNYNIEIL